CRCGRFYKKCSGLSEAVVGPVKDTSRSCRSGPRKRGLRLTKALQRTAALPSASSRSKSARAAATELGRSGAKRSRRCHCNALFGVTLHVVLSAIPYRDLRHGRGVKLPRTT